MTFISNSVFENFHNEGDGSVLYLSGTSICIVCCSFSDNSITENGGCFYFTDVNCNITKSTFIRTYSTKKENNVCGNVLYQFKIYFCISDVSTNMCGTAEQYSDSSIRLDHVDIIIIQYYNATSNYGEGGGSGFSITYSSPDARISYATIYDAQDTHGFECEKCHATITKVNFAKFHKEKNAAVYWVDEDYSVEFISCVFADLDGVKIALDYHKYKAVDCVSDDKYDSIEQKDTVSLLVFNIKTNCNVVSFYSVRLDNSEKHIIHAFFVFISLFIYMKH